MLTEAGDLYFWTERLDGPGERDVYVARGDGAGGFLNPQPLGAAINTRGREDGAWITPDGKTLLLSISGRADEAGGGDLYVSRRTGEDAWSEPISLGPTVNSPYADGSGRITPDGRDLVFTSTRPVTPGGPEILQVWTVPVAAVPALAE